MLQAIRPNRARTTALLAIVVLLFALGGSLLSTAAQRPNGAGLVIRHGDGTMIYAYVQFDEESISGLDLITRSGIDVTLAPFGGLGGGVCSINGEGCPSDNCFCHSYQSPAYYWHYYANSEGGWSTLPIGPAARTLYDGDIDGWSWTSGESGLPAVTIDDIALMNGIDRNPPEPTSTPEPPPTFTPVPEPTATFTPAPTETPAPAPTATSTPQPTAVPDEPTATATATATEPTPTLEPVATATTIPSTATPTITSTPIATSTAIPTATATPQATPTPVPTSGAVVVAPGGTPEPLDTTPPGSESGSASYVWFAGVAALVIAVCGIAVYRQRTPTS